MDAQSVVTDTREGALEEFSQSGWVTVTGCLSVAMLFALALIAV